MANGGSSATQKLTGNCSNEKIVWPGAPMRNQCFLSPTVVDLNKEIKTVVSGNTLSYLEIEM